MRSVITGLAVVILMIADLVNDFLDKNGPHIAAAITYYFLVSLFPLTVTVLSVLSFFNPSPAEQARLALAFSILVPVTPEAFSEFFAIVTRNRHVLSVVGLAGLVMSSTTVFSAVRKGINTVWGVRTPRPFFQERLIDLTLAAGAGILMLMPMVATAAAGYLGQASATLLPRPIDPSLLVVRIIPFLAPLLSLSIFLGAYVLLPNTSAPFRDMWPVASLAALAFEGARSVFLWYAHTFPVYDAVYGPVGALVGFLTWVYLSAMILLFGALVASRFSASMARWIEEHGEVLLSPRKPPARTPQQKRKRHVSWTPH